MFPHDLGDNVHRLGHNAESSFGAHSYLVVRDGANVMVDAPRWTHQLIDPMEALGGIDLVLLTHRDDVADADRYAERFNASVWIHEDDRSEAPYATDLVRGTEPVEVTAGVTGFPVPGHRDMWIPVWLADDLETVTPNEDGYPFGAPQGST